MSGPARPEIEVLLATYNGERFLREQMLSLAGQDYPEVRILARDDGSSDATAKMLAEYAAQYPEQIRLLPSDAKTGSAKGNFRRLLRAATGPYVAFADQDDVWLPTKLTRSMDQMAQLESRHPAGTPLLVFTDLRVVDESLKTIHGSLWKHLGLNPKCIHNAAGLLGRSVVTGCTMLINEPMLELARQMPEAAVMHDRWIGLLAATLGAADFLREPTVLYRQHDGNVVGAAGPDGSLAGTLRRTQRSGGRWAERERSEAQAEALLSYHRTQLPKKMKDLVKLYLRSGRSSSRVVRVWLTLRHGFFRGSIAANAALLLQLALAPSER